MAVIFANFVVVRTSDARLPEPVHVTVGPPTVFFTIFASPVTVRFTFPIPLYLVVVPAAAA